jgi:hypothetical protein
VWTPDDRSPRRGHRLFVAVGGLWQGYFVLKDEILWCPEDKRCPYALLFDPRTWVDIKALPTKRFRGFTYNTPKPDDILPTPPNTSPPLPSTPDPGHTSPPTGGSSPPGSGSRPDRE